MTSRNHISTRLCSKVNSNLIQDKELVNKNSSIFYLKINYSKFFYSSRIKLYIKQNK